MLNPSLPFPGIDNGTQDFSAMKYSRKHSDTQYMDDHCWLLHVHVLHLAADGFTQVQDGVLSAGAPAPRHSGLQCQDGGEQVVRLILVAGDVGILMQAKDLRLGQGWEGLDCFNVVRHHL